MAGQEGLSKEPSTPQKASLPREERSGLKEKEMNWVGRARGDGTKEVRLWVEPLGQLSPNMLDSDSSYVGNSTDYLGDLIVLCPNI